MVGYILQGGGGYILQGVPAMKEEIPTLSTKVETSDLSVRHLFGHFRKSQIQPKQTQIS